MLVKDILHDLIETSINVDLFKYMGASSDTPGNLNGLHHLSEKLQVKSQAVQLSFLDACLYGKQGTPRSCR